MMTQFAKHLPHSRNYSPARTERYVRAGVLASPRPEGGGEATCSAAAGIKPRAVRVYVLVEDYSTHGWIRSLRTSR